MLVSEISGEITRGSDIQRKESIQNVQNNKASDIQRKENAEEKMIEIIDER